MPKLVVGYIVVDKLGRPMTYYTKYQRFFYFSNAAPTYFARNRYDYEAMRRLRALHYQSINRDWEHLPQEHRDILSDLKIRGMRGPQQGT
ncbi:MAG: hypothetical protein ABL952_17635 [Pyrinomonadaceae bacterium]